MGFDQVPTENTDGANQIWNRATLQIEEILQFTALQQRLITYSEVSSGVTALSLEPRSFEFARLLCERIDYDVTNDQPLLSSIVIGRRTNRPGRGFFQYMRRYFLVEDDDLFWLSEVKSVHDYYRRSHRSSTPTKAIRRASLANVKKTDALSEKDFILSFFD